MLKIRQFLLLTTILTTTLIFLSAHSALATPVIYSFTGTTTFQNGDFAGQGSNVTGTFRFDDGLTDGKTASRIAQYDVALPANALLAGGFAYSITVGATTKSGTGATASTSVLELTDDFASDSVSFRVGASPADFFLLRALGGSGNDVVLPPAPGGISPISDIVGVLDALNPAGFAGSPSIWSGGSDNQVQFTWDSITPIPEPTTGVLLGLGLLGLGARRTRRD
jgi:hypothetical protein